MVHKKHASKRIPAARRYSVAKKVTAAHRKARKEAALNPTWKSKLKKDPGVPNLFPLKESILVAAQEHKTQLAAEKEAAAAARRAAQAAGISTATAGAREYAAMVQSATVRSMMFDGGEIGNGTGIASSVAPYRPAQAIRGGYDDVEEEAATSGRKDNSRKAYYREFKKVIDEADVILEVLDARDPMGCRTKDIEEMILNAGSNKRIILILNKIDLVPRDVCEKWLKFLRNDFPTVAFKASTQSQRSNLGHSSISTALASEGALNSSECLGADTLVRLLKNYCRNANLKTSITVGVVGYPNVGKSSLINSLKRSKVCSVGATPGMTKVAQAIHLDKNVKLLDCPGIVFSKTPSGEAPSSASDVLRNCIKVELLTDPVSPVEFIVSRCSKDQLMTLYGVPFFGNTSEFLLLVAKQRGKLRKGGIPDIESAARSVLQDWNTGRIPFYTLPPAVSAQTITANSAIVSSWSKEFDMDAVIVTEGKSVLSSLPSRDQIPHRMLTLIPGTEGTVDMNVNLSDMGRIDGDEMMMDMDANEATNSAMHQSMTASESTTAQPEIRFRVLSNKDTVGHADRVQIKKATSVLDDFESALNPQVNKNLKKIQKLKKKAALKMHKQGQSQSGDMDMEEGGGTASYDFSEHFDAMLPDASDSD